MRPVCRGPGWDGHLLLLYDEESQRRREVEAWVRRGLDVGAKILYIEPRDESPARSLSGLLADQPKAVEAMRTGQIQVIPAESAAYDLDWQSSVVEQALREYPFVRWSGDATTAWGVMPEGRHAEVEWATDEVCRSRQVSVMCQYPAGASMGVLGNLSAAHGAGLRERLLELAPLQGGGLAVSGEVDLSNQHILLAVLSAATRTTDRDPFGMDLSGLAFLDVAGLRALMAGTDRYRRLGVDREPGFVTEVLG